VPESDSSASLVPGRLAVLPPGRDSAGSSAMVFHSPQVSHLPAHLPVTAPQD